MAWCKWKKVPNSLLLLWKGGKKVEHAGGTLAFQRAAQGTDFFFLLTQGTNRELAYFGCLDTEKKGE